MVKGMSKGSSFERKICKRLSQWWTDGKRDDVFWRTAGSGARAKTRSKTGRRTFGQYGDIQATDPIGQPLIDVCSIELKRGYPYAILNGCMDKPSSAAVQHFEEFIIQAATDACASGSFSWMLITQRNRRETMIWMAKDLYNEIKAMGSSISECIPGMVMRFDGAGKEPPMYSIYGTTLENFLERVQPKHFKKLKVKWKVPYSKDTPREDWDMNPSRIKCPNCEEELYENSQNRFCPECNYGERI